MKKVILEKLPKKNMFYGYDASDLEVKSFHDRAIVVLEDCINWYYLNKK